MTEAQGQSYLIREVAELLRVGDDFVIHCLRCHWIEPADPAEARLDAEDLARISLIRDLQQEFGVNDEAVPIILHLIDELHLLRAAQRSRR